MFGHRANGGKCIVFLSIDGSQILGISYSDHEALHEVMPVMISVLI